LETLAEINCGLFSEAAVYMHQLIESIDPDARPAMYTGFYVFLNTLGELARQELK
jgi:hypothetical protein